MSRKRGASRPSSPDADRRLLEQQRLAMIGCLTAGLGHDIRNAVMPALLRADALSASPELSDAARRDLDGIRASILGLQRLATGLRLLSQDGRDDVTGTHLETWWKEVGPLLSASLGAGTKIEVLIPDALPTTKVPSNLIAQVALALTMNARIWMQDALAPRVTLRAHALRKCVYLTLQFSGQPTEFNDWSPESSLDLPTDSPVEAFSGLSLKRVRELLAEYGGDLHLNQMDDHSGSFTITLPLQESQRGNRTALGTQVRLELGDPRQLAVARLILAQRGLVEWSEQDRRASPPLLVVCDRASLAMARERISRVDDELAPRLIVVGVPETAAEQQALTWVLPSRLGTLADVLQ